MNRVARTLLVLGAVVLAFLIGVLVGRGRHEQPVANDAAETAAAGMQINTAAPPPTIQPLPPPPPAPKRAPVPKLDPNAQVNADAAAVGMTTPDQPPPPTDSGATSAPANTEAPPNG